MASILALSTLLASASAYTCTDFFAQVPATANNYKPTFSPFQNHYDSVQFLANQTARDASSYPPALGAAQSTSQTFTIGATYCKPDGKANGDVQVLTHGLGFDRTYWNFGGPNSQYNYVQTATDAGYAALFYDRIGTGLSSHPDPYSVGQSPIELAVLQQLTRQLKNGTLNASIPKSTGKVYHVGHSFGSLLSNALAAATPELSDGLALTGYSTNSSFMPQFIVATNFHLANQNSPRFSSLSDGYITWSDELANQYMFFHYPNFSPATLAADESTKQPFTVGEFLTSAPPFAPKNMATAFAKPVLIISGHYDKPFCGSNCDGILETAASSFPVAKPFKTYQQPETGHAINLHNNATAAFKVVQNFFAQNA